MLLTAREIFALITATILAIIFGFLVNWSFTELLSDQAVIAYFLIGGILTVLVYGFKPRTEAFFKQYEKHFDKKESENSQEKDLLRKIHEELKDGIESLDGTLDRTTNKVKIDDKMIPYKHIFMNHNVYDSLVNSGDYNQIGHEFQQDLQNIYQKIIKHDEYVQKIADTVDSPDLDKYYLILNQYEKDLLKDIPIMMEKLKKYFQ